MTASSPVLIIGLATADQPLDSIPCRGQTNPTYKATVKCGAGYKLTSHKNPVYLVYCQILDRNYATAQVDYSCLPGTAIALISMLRKGKILIGASDLISSL
ncbi:hypothetical protein BDV23DRAFT_157824 [Aspergillus alliaceus]|uniref:Uncharacterized protein n=1 Tax=Petromyces alliaceus TaxID=209559 RepID=A0A5N7C4H0_PETAA|nr:hypothetical protein BDV23DRAFT_157824 [Aspergillus alliaceus]